MGFGRMKREANRDRETFDERGGEREMDEREMEEVREVEEEKGVKRRRWWRWRRYGRKANERVAP